jgi:hypothetical protein
MAGPSAPSNPRKINLFRPRIFTATFSSFRAALFACACAGARAIHSIEILQFSFQLKRKCGYHGISPRYFRPGSHEMQLLLRGSSNSTSTAGQEAYFKAHPKEKGQDRWEPR